MVVTHYQIEFMFPVVVVVVEIKEGSHNPAEMVVTAEVLLVELDLKVELVEPINQVQI